MVADIVWVWFRRKQHRKERDMARFIGFHNTPIANTTLTASVDGSLCVADSQEAAESYRRGLKAQHYCYEVEVEGKIMSEKQLKKLLVENGYERYVEDGEEYQATKKTAVRELIVEAGFDAVCYTDTNGFDYVCCEIFSQGAIVSVTLCNEIAE
jgi:hypothetical protein